VDPLGKRRFRLERLGFCVLWVLAAVVAIACQAAEPDDEDVATRALLRAAERGRPKQVRTAIEKGARLDENRVAFAGEDRQSALVAAALQGHAGVVRVLLEAGADPTVPEKDGFTVWHAAAFQGRAKVLVVLDELSVPGFGISEIDGFTPLHRAAWGRRPGHVAAVRFLIGPGGRDCQLKAENGARPVDRAPHPRIRALLEACAAEQAAEAEAP
jgi:ankyrin repeat protein